MDQVAHNSLLGLQLPELAALVEEFGQPSYRARQLFEASLPAKSGNCRADFDAAPGFPTEPVPRREFPSVCPASKRNLFRATERCAIWWPVRDGQSVETVWMPEGDGGEAGDGSEAGNQTETAGRTWERATICVSSQVGCAVDCQFCLTALLGIKRNLTAGEIVGQVCAVLNDQGVSLPLHRINLVFMGMGEPFLNYGNFMKAVHLLVEGVGIPESRMTVSTAGIVPRIYDFGLEPVRPKLAISLNASNDDLRTRLMPINRKWNLEKLMAAAREFPLRNREKLTFEYVLLDGVNDSAENAREVVELVRGLRAKLNLIALNPGPGIDFRTPAQERVLQFQNILRAAGVPAFVRRPRGRDIYAACGQLKRTVELAS